MKKLFFPIAFSFLFLFTSCIKDNYIDPIGSIVTETRDIRNFDGVEINGAFEVHLIQDKRSKVVIEGIDEVVAQVETFVSKGLLVVQLRNGYNYRTSNIHIWIYAPEIYEIDLNGSGLIQTDNVHNFGDYLETTLNGSGTIRLRGDARTVSAKNTGSGYIRLSGNGNFIKAHTSGSGDIDALDYVVDEAEAKSWGSGDVLVNVWRYLYAEVNGSGDIIYKSNPRIEAYRTGSGTIRRY